MENFLSACHLLKMAVSPCVCCSAGNGYVWGDEGEPPYDLKHVGDNRCGCGCDGCPRDCTRVGVA